MSSARPGAPGATRECPHCRETILESAAVCPACRHYLRFDAGAGADASQAPAPTPLRIEGSIRHPADGEPWEYTVVVSIRNDRDEEIAHKLIGVGAITAGVTKVKLGLSTGSAAKGWCRPSGIYNGWRLTAWRSTPTPSRC